MRRWVFFVVHNRTSLVIISDAARPAPKLRAIWRKGRSVTPAMGASTTDELSSYGPIRMWRCSACSAAPRVVGAADGATLSAQTGIDLETNRGLAWIDDMQFSVDALVR